MPCQVLPPPPCSHQFPVQVSAAIFMASQASSEKRTQKEIGDFAGVAEATIKQSYKVMYPKAVELFPADFEFVTPISLLPAQ